MDCPECDGTGQVETLEPGAYGGRRYKLERGWKRTWLLHQLARAEASNHGLARALKVDHRAVDRFAIRHKDEIESIRKRMEDEFQTLWIASKVARLAEYQQDVEDITGIIDAAFDPPESGPLDPTADQEKTQNLEALPQWLRVKHAALRAAAEELGQIPNKINMTVGGGQVITYRVEGVDLEQLR